MHSNCHTVPPSPPPAPHHSVLCCSPRERRSPTSTREVRFSACSTSRSSSLTPTDSPWSSTTPPACPHKRYPDIPKMCPDRLKIYPDIPKRYPDIPKCTQTDPKCTQTHPKGTQTYPKCTQTYPISTRHDFSTQTFKTERPKVPQPRVALSSASVVHKLNNAYCPLKCERVFLLCSECWNHPTKNLINFILVFPHSLPVPRTHPGGVGAEACLCIKNNSLPQATGRQNMFRRSKFTSFPVCCIPS